MDEETRAFLSQHFAAIAQRFDAMQGEFRQLVEENRRHFGVLAEDLRADVRGIAEGHDTLLRSIDRTREEGAREHRELLAVMTLGHSGLDHRVSGLEVRATEHEVRLRRLEDR
jgi:hypothetical protein